MKRFSVLLGVAFAIGSLPAQSRAKVERAHEEPVPAAEQDPPAKDDPNRIGAELARLRLELQRLTIDEERLLELRIRHGLGLATDSAAPFLVQESDRVVAGSASDRSLRDEEGQLSDLTRQLDEMQRKVAADQAKHPTLGDPEIPKLPSTDTARRPQAPKGADSGPTRRGDPKAPETPASRPQDPRRPRSEGPPKLLISGSTDRSTVGRVLFHAGRFKEAKAELEDAVKLENPDLQDLFLLGQCYEKLGEPANADGQYKKVEALDSKETPQGRVAGPWAEAARAASRQMNWMVDHGEWKLPRPVDSIEWRKGRR